LSPPQSRIIISFSKALNALEYVEPVVAVTQFMKPNVKFGRPLYFYQSYSVGYNIHITKDFSWEFFALKSEFDAVLTPFNGL
jgi:hypothetical protein